MDGSSDLGWADVGERQQPRPGCPRHLAGLMQRDPMLVSPGSATIGSWRFWLVRHSLGARPPVQRESTATGADLTGLVRTLWDGDLRGQTPVDVLPVDGMQEVRGSNPRSSTSSCTYFEYETDDHACP